MFGKVKGDYNPTLALEEIGQPKNVLGSRSRSGKHPNVIKNSQRHCMQFSVTAIMKLAHNQQNDKNKRRRGG